MRFRKSNYILSGFLFALILFKGSAYGWKNDNGLEESVDHYRELFRNKNLYVLFSDYTDSDLKKEIFSLIRKIGKDKKTAGLVAERLGFPSAAALNKAEPESIVKRMIFNMQNPPAVPGAIINNRYYMESYLTLSLLFAPYDKNLSIDKKKVNSKSAEIDFSCREYTVTAFYVLRKNIWYMTTEKYIR
ncbi:MAG: hypothetical protein JW982_13145 [Spirochaetes bacterium]|nr:hypothetical protein [Spirochaetota bacterium]